MLKEILFNNNANILLSKMLDKAAQKQRVISATISNVNTPGYQKRDVSFDEKLKQAMRPSLKMMVKTDPHHLPDPNIIRNIKCSSIMQNASIIKTFYTILPNM